MLKKLSILVLPIVLALSAMMIIGNVSTNAVAQQSRTNTMDQSTMQGNQMNTQGNQMNTQGNQMNTQGNKQISATTGQKLTIPATTDEKLMNYTSAAIKALKSGDKKTLTSMLRTLQSALINASGKQPIILPDTFTSSGSSGSTSGSSGSTHTHTTTKSK